MQDRGAMNTILLINIFNNLRDILILQKNEVQFLALTSAILAPKNTYFWSLETHALICTIRNTNTQIYIHTKLLQVYTYSYSYKHKSIR